MRPVQRPTLTAVAATAAAVLALLTGCAAEGTPEIDLDRLQEQVSSEVDDARQSLDDLRSTAAEATGMGAAEQAALAEAASSASTALNQARQAAADAAESAGPTTDAALAEARAALDGARDSIDAVAADASGTLRSSLESLSTEIDRLAQQLDTAQ